MPVDIRDFSRRTFLVGSAAASLSASFPSFASVNDESLSQLSCEVLICGATPAGIAAAVTAAGLGRKVILAEYEDHIGGIVSNGLTIADLRKRNAVGGFFNRFQQRINDYYRETNAGSQPMQNLRPWYQQVPPVIPWGGGAFTSRM
jgi:NADPH-dependent 2,4-dienoyl-CoA reductase/sulfur reductase-like enzyme